MLCLKLVEEIDRLLHEGQLSQRKIALRLGVSRGTVHAIASGQRGLFGKDPLQEMPTSTPPLLPPERCPECGFRVYKPCLVCRTRAFRDLRRREQRFALEGGTTMAPARRRPRAPRARAAKPSRVA
jgi:hypothetical protein